MASEGPGLIVNGGQASKSPAALLSEQHEKHTVTVEDTVDEEDIQHPPPSSLVKPSAESSEAAAPPVSKPTKAPALDVQSEELFPALGSGPKSKAAANVPTAWGAKRPAAAASQNGAAGITQPSSMFQISLVNFYPKLKLSNVISYPRFFECAKNHDPPRKARGTTASRSIADASTESAQETRQRYLARHFKTIKGHCRFASRTQWIGYF